MKDPRYIVELVGLPGVGKTALAETWKSRDQSIHIHHSPYFRDVRHVPLFAKHLLLMLPTIMKLRAHSGKGRLTRRDVALMTILRGWGPLLVKESCQHRAPVVLDEGAICLLARLRRSSSDLLKGQEAAMWWKEAFRQWARVISLVVQLEAPVPALVERIRGRDRQYEMRGMSDPQILAHLAHIQESLAYALSGLTSCSDSLQVLHYDTTRVCLDQICNDLLECELDPNRPRGALP